MPAGPRPPYRPDRLLLQWHLSERCNLRCAHCYQDAYHDDEAPDFAAWLDVVARFKAFLAVPGRPPLPGRLTLTGGEPFALKAFPDLLDALAAQRRHFDFAILSNGTLIDAALARRLRDWRPAFVQVSLDGGAATHDRIRGPGSFARAVAGLENLVAAGVCASIAFTAQRSNYREFPAVARLGRQLKVRRVWADRLIPSGHGQRDEVLSPGECREFLALMRQARSEAIGARGNTTEIALHRALQFLAGGDSIYRCPAGDTLLTLMPDGRVFPCRRLPIPVGNLRQQSLDELYDAPTLARLRTPSAEVTGCGDCLYASECRGGLRCLSYALVGDLDGADPGCWLARHA